MASRGDKQPTNPIGELIEGAEVVPLKGRAASSEADPRPRSPSGDDRPEDRIGGGRRAVVKNMLPDGCPVQPLGTAEGLYFYLDELRQIRVLKPKEHEKKNLESLFGRRSDLCEQLWPRYAAKPDDEGKPIINGWKPEEAGRQLMAECAQRGIWRSQGRVRGAGAHRDEYGGLILHCGDRIWIGAQQRWEHPGLIEDNGAAMVYPAAEKLPRFSPMPADTGCGQKLMAMLSTWRWERSADGEDYGVDPMLMLGWIAAAMVCGALEWRPAAWLTGGRGTGKSHLQKLIKMLFERGGLLQAADATEAYIRQLLGMRTLPVALDELEAQADNRKVQAIITLARLASSGGTIGRGGQDHNPHDFVAQSSFLFSSILTPPLTPQDRSRIAMLELRPFEEGDKAPELDPQEMGALGRDIRRRMVDGWERLPETIDMFRKWLAQYGHDARMQDQFGTLLACADLVLFDDLSDDENYYQAWAARLDARHLAEKADDESEGELCTRHIATSPLQAVGGALPETVAMFIVKAIGAGIPDGDTGVDNARKRLEANGLKLVSSWTVQDGGELRRKVSLPAPMNPDRPMFVAVANRHRGMDALMRDTRWNGGVWSQALKRLPGAIAKHNVKIGGRNEWSVLVPLAVFVATEKEEGGE
ncbi:MAG: hypothetical protein M3Q08_00980 [Pseudomonadota bacterium]|nr:hypothetical protein [Pseudomonadota bacterium]